MFERSESPAKLGFRKTSAHNTIRDQASDSRWALPLPWLVPHVLLAPGDAGCARQTIQELAGHQELSVTQGYMHRSPDMLGSSIQLLESRPKPHGHGDIVETSSTENGS